MGKGLLGVLGPGLTRRGSLPARKGHTRSRGMKQEYVRIELKLNRVEPFLTHGRSPILNLLVHLLKGFSTLVVLDHTGRAQPGPRRPGRPRLQNNVKVLHMLVVSRGELHLNGSLCYRVEIIYESDSKFTGIIRGCMTCISSHGGALSFFEGVFHGLLHCEPYTSSQPGTEISVLVLACSACN